MSQKLCPSFEKPGASKVPGPGTYQDTYKTTRSKEPEWRIGTSQRDDKLKISRRTCNFPPPDSYNPLFKSTKNAEPTWGFGTSKRQGLTVGKSVAPSMQSYNIPSKAVEGSTWLMGEKLANKSSIGNSATNYVPGAGTYDPDFHKA